MVHNEQTPWALWSYQTHETSWAVPFKKEYSPMISLDSRMEFYDQNSEKKTDQKPKVWYHNIQSEWPCPKHFSSDTLYFRTVSFINDSGTFFAVSLVSRLVSGLGSGVLITSCSTVLLYSTSWKPATVVVSSISIYIKLCRNKKTWKNLFKGTVYNLQSRLQMSNLNY